MSQDTPRKIKIEIVKDAFPDISEGFIRKILKVSKTLFHRWMRYSPQFNSNISGLLIVKELEHAQ